MENKNNTEIFTQLTEEQINEINKISQESIEGTIVEEIQNFPSNNGVEEVPEENREKGEFKRMNVMVDPNSGEQKIIPSSNSSVGLEDEETFEEMCERLEKTDYDFSLDPVTEKDVLEFLSKTDKESSSILADLVNNDKEIDISAQDVQKLLSVVNRKLEKEDFNVYRELPRSIQTKIDEYIIKSGIPINALDGRRIRNEMADVIISDFARNIVTEKSVYDFNREMENMVKLADSEMSKITCDYIINRNRMLRERIEKEEDPKKKENGMKFLEAIDESYNLDGLKLFSTKCKIKKFDLEKPSRIFETLLSKYRESSYNIYDINLTRPILYRHLNADKTDEFNDKDVNAFLICFCKQCLNKKSEIATDNLYMYNVIFNIIWLDLQNRSSNSENLDENSQLYSDGFLNNVKEIIYNLRERNSSLN